jgi:hypothetical protein
MNFRLLISGIFILFSGIINAQNPKRALPVDTLSTQGGWVGREIIDGDTFYTSTLRTVKIVAVREYKDRTERDKLARYRRYAAHVYPYAVQAIDLYDEIETSKDEMSKRQHRKYVRHQKKEIKEDFEDKLKQLYKTEGFILVKMIERQTNKPFYEIIKDTRGTIAATYWQNLGKIWGFDLKEGYIKGSDPLLDEVLLDYDFGDAIWRY